MENLLPSKNNRLLKIFLFVFIFTRTIVLIPLLHFGISLQPMNYTFSFEALLMWPLMLAYTFLMVTLICKIYNKIGKNFDIILCLIFADCVFFTTLDDCLKLIVVIFGLLSALNALKDKPLIKTDITVIAFVIISSFLIPLSVFSFVPLAFMIYILCNANNKSRKKYTVMVLAVVCIALGIVANKLLSANVQVFAEFIDKFGFSNVVRTNKSWHIFLVLLPTIILSYLFFDKFFKNQSKARKKDKNNQSSFLVDLVSIPFVVSVIGLIFFESESFLTANLFFPIALLVSILKKDDIVQTTLSYFEEKINKHKLIAIMILASTFYCCFSILDGYNGGEKLIQLIRY